MTTRPEARSRNHQSNKDAELTPSTLARSAAFAGARRGVDGWVLALVYIPALRFYVSSTAEARSLRTPCAPKSISSLSGAMA